MFAEGPTLHSNRLAGNQLKPERGGGGEHTPLQPAAVRGAEENKSIKAWRGSGALVLALPGMGGATLQRGRHREHLIQLGSQRGLQREQAAGGGRGGGLRASLTKTFNPSLLPPLNRPH